MMTKNETNNEGKSIQEIWSECQSEMRQLDRKILKVFGVGVLVTIVAVALTAVFMRSSPYYRLALDLIYNGLALFLFMLLAAIVVKGAKLSLRVYRAKKARGIAWWKLRW